MGTTECGTMKKIKLGTCGRGRTAFVSFELKDRKGRPVFSAQGEVYNAIQRDIDMGGQCLDHLDREVKEWEPGARKKFYEIRKVWETYHLNDMHAECEHQRALGWGEKVGVKVVQYRWTLTDKAYSGKKKAEAAALEALAKGETFTPSKEQAFLSGLDYMLNTWTPEPPKELAPFYEASKSATGGMFATTETKTLGWLDHKEHPEGLLGRPCPTCGYKYGHEWKYMPIPQEVIDQIKSW